MSVHIRTKALNEFQESLGKAVTEKINVFDVAVVECIDSSMCLFDKQCEEANIEKDQDFFDARTKLQGDIDLVVARVSPLVKKREKYRSLSNKLVKVTKVAYQIGTCDVNGILELLGVDDARGMIEQAVEKAAGGVLHDVFNDDIMKAICQGDSSCVNNKETITQVVVDKECVGERKEINDQLKEEVKKTKKEKDSNEEELKEVVKEGKETKKKKMTRMMNNLSGKMMMK